MATVEELRLEFKAEINDVKSKLATLQRSLKDTTTNTSKMQSTFAKMRDVMQGPIAAFKMVAGAVISVAQTFDKLVMGAVESEKSLSNLGATLNATGSSMGLVQLNDLAETLSQTTLFDDDDIRQAEAVLVTFKKIGEDVFPEVVSIATDMATVLGKDLQQVMTQLGKALDDPVKGMTQLGRFGVQLSETQKKQIDSFVKLNDVASAQGIIMGELKSKYEGAAEAAANTATGAYIQLKKAIGEVTEGLGLYAAGIFNAMGATEKLNKFASALGNQATIKSVQELFKAIEINPKTAVSLQTLEMGFKAVGEEIGRIRDWKGENAKEKKFLEEYLRLYRRLETMISDRKKIEESRSAAAKEASDAENKQTAANLEAAEAAKKRSDEETAYHEMRAAAQREADGLAEQGAATMAMQQEAAIASAQAEAEAWLARYEGAEHYDRKIGEITESEKAMADAAMSGFVSMSEALGTALVSGEEGWKGFAKAGLNAIASVIEAMATKAKIIAGDALLAILGGDLTKIPQLAQAASQIALASAAAGAVRAIPMAEGGEGIVTKPTLFLAGEKGPEPYAFGGTNNKRGMGSTVNHYHIAGSLLSEKQLSARVRGAMAYSGRDY